MPSLRIAQAKTGWVVICSLAHGFVISCANVWIRPLRPAHRLLTLACTPHGRLLFPWIVELYLFSEPSVGSVLSKWPPPQLFFFFYSAHLRITLTSTLPPYGAPVLGIFSPSLNYAASVLNACSPLARQCPFYIATPALPHPVTFKPRLTAASLL